MWCKKYGGDSSLKMSEILYLSKNQLANTVVKSDVPALV
jgi:hypothetical protein